LIFIASLQKGEKYMKLEPMAVEDAGEREEKQRDKPSQLSSLWEDAGITQENSFARSLQMWYARGRENRGLDPFGSVPAPRQAFTHTAGTPDTHQYSGWVLLKSASSR
jgi:hypothetical protein